MEYKHITAEEYRERMKLMDIYREKYLKSIAIFQENKDNADVGVNLDLDVDNFLNKTGEELITDISLKEHMRHIRSVDYHNVLVNPIKEYGLAEWLVCLDENIFIDCAIAMLSKVIAVDSYAVDYDNIPLICYVVWAYKQCDFEHKNEWHSYFSDIVKSVLNDERVHTLDEKVIDLLSQKRIEEI